MKVIEIARPGGPEVLRIAERCRPVPGDGEILIRVEAAGVNRPDIQQRRGLYPPPADASDIPGLDVAGRVEVCGPRVSTVAPGDQVCALVNGGGYAQYCVVPALQVMPCPQGFSSVQAASLPEVFFTAWNNVIWLGRLAHGETLLIQGGTSGVGLAAMQIARVLLHARVFATAGSAEKRAFCRACGADGVVDYHAADWPEQVRSLAGAQGVDLVLDSQAGAYTQRQLDLLNPDGRVVLIASHLGEIAEVNVRAIVRRRLTLTGSTLRPRDAVYKGRIASELVRQVWPYLATGVIKTHICKVFSWQDARAAHEFMDDNGQIGKVVLDFSQDR